jgi:cytochrome c-type biogenesis protein CcmH/NrfG
VIVLVALAACAWLLAQYHQAQLTASAKSINLDPFSKPAEFRDGISDAEGVGWLNPDPYEARVFQALLEIRAGQRDTAVRRLESVVRDQPNFIEAWRLLAQVTAESDPARSAQAETRSRELDPLGAARSR